MSLLPRWQGFGMPWAVLGRTWYRATGGKICPLGACLSQTRTLNPSDSSATSVVNEAIKPFQTQGLLGERDIERRPLEACPIPLFDPKNPLHLEIAEVARLCREELLPIVPK